MADLRMPDINEVRYAGRLTREPELSYTGQGAAVCGFAIAVSEKYKNKTTGAAEEKTVFIDCKCWNQTAEFVGERIKKGDPVLVTGKTQSESWEDKKTGAKRTKLVTLAFRVQPLSWSDSNSPGGGQQRGGHSSAPKPRAIEEPIPEDDIPF